MLLSCALMINLICTPTCLKKNQRAWVYKSVWHVIRLLYNKQAHLKSFYPNISSIIIFWVFDFI